jgi:hypothetical protein
MQNNKIIKNILFSIKILSKFAIFISFTLLLLDMYISINGEYNKLYILVPVIAYSIILNIEISEYMTKQSTKK